MPAPKAEKQKAHSSFSNYLAKPSSKREANHNQYQYSGFYERLKNMDVK